MSKVARYIGYGQLCLLGFLTVCFVLKPEGVTGNLGISFYGNYKSTIMPYLLGLLSSSCFMIKAARMLPRNDKISNALADVLGLLAILVIIVLLTPYSFGDILGWAHLTASIIYFAVEFVVAYWLLIVALHDKWQYLLFLILILGILIAILSLTPSIQLMVLAQVVTQISFSIYLIRAVNNLRI